MSIPRMTEIMESTYNKTSGVINVASKTATHTFHSVVTQAGNGTSLTIGEYQKLTLGISGTSTSRTIEFHVIDENGIDDVIQGIKPKDFSTASFSSGNNETWQFEISGYVTFYAKITAVAGGNVTIKGRVMT